MRFTIEQLSNIKARFDSRIDAEFYQPLYKEMDKLLKKKNPKALSELAIKITDGTHFTPSYKSLGTPFLSAINVKENFLDINCGFQFISKEEHQILYKRCAPVAGDILLRKVGVGPRYATVIPKDIFEFSLFVSVALLKITNINSYYLSTFINSKYGQLQLLRFNKGISQPDLHLEDIATLQVPILSIYFQNNIETIIEKSNKYEKMAKNYLDSSNVILAKELRLEDIKLYKELTFSIKNYSDVKDANRFDAEYFQPKYDETIKSIKNYFNGYAKLKNIAKIKDVNFIPKSKEEYKYIELANIAKSGEINDCTLDFGENLPTRARRIVSTGDVLVSSIEGSLDSVALITSDNNNSLCSTGFYVITSNSINSETLFCLMKSEFIQMQLKRGCSGTILTAINKDEFESIILPRINDNVQIQIKENIQEMYKLKRQSKQLLEIAKRGVEIAIEQDEDIATRWINQEMQKIGVGL